MGGNAVKVSRPVTFEEAEETIKWIKKHILPYMNFWEEDIQILGSYGKKLEGETYNDIDIAVQIPRLEHFPNATQRLAGLLEGWGYQTKMNPGFGICSFGCPIKGDYDNGVVQIDFMLTYNLQWSKFIYHSPDFRKGESKYKGLYRNILLMALITEPEKEFIKMTSEGGIEEIEVNILRYPRGVWRVRKNFMGKKGKLVKNGYNVEGSERFVTDNPMEIIDMTVGSEFIPTDIDTFEKLWDIVMSSNFKWINKREGIINRFIECLGEQNLSLPKEVEEWIK
jgi:hypothetical protein